MTKTKVLAITGSGAVGWHPLAPGTWSGSSRAFFSLIEQRGFLGRAFGVEAPLPQKWAFMAKHVHPDRKRWRRQFYMDTRYRDALTRAVRRQLIPSDFEYAIVQIGAMFNGPEAAGGRIPAFTYMDSNVAVSLRSPYSPKGLSPRAIERIVAYERRVYHSMRAIFTAGHYLRDSLVRDFQVPPDRITVLGMGINLPRIPEFNTRKAYDRQELLYVGSGFVRKGGPTLLHAFRAVRERFPAATLHIVGPKSLKLTPDLAAGVVYHGHLSKNRPEDWNRLDELFRRSALFVLPSLYEPFGIAPLEAMVYQTPCVVTNIQALKEFVIPGDTGEVVEPDSVESLQAALIRLLSDPAELQRMGNRARQLVLDRYTWPVIVDRFLTVMLTALEGRSLAGAR